MKNKFCLLIAIASSFLISCSSEDSGNGQNESFSFPLTNGKYWTYDITGDAGSFRDSLYISGDTLINAKTYKRFDTKDIPAGFYSSSLRNNGVRESNGKLLLSGDLSLASGQQLPIALDLTLSDFVIYKKNAANDELLATKSGVIEQTVQGYPLTINYSLKSYKGQNLSSFTLPNSDVYTDVKTVKIVLRASASMTISGFNIPVLQSQDVLVSTQYIANNIGVVYTNTVTSYNVSEQIATELGIPQTETQTQQESLDTYN